MKHLSNAKDFLNLNRFFLANLLSSSRLLNENTRSQLFSIKNHFPKQNTQQRKKRGYIGISSFIVSNSR